MALAPKRIPRFHSEGVPSVFNRGRNRVDLSHSVTQHGETRVAGRCWRVAGAFLHHIRGVDHQAHVTRFGVGLDMLVVHAPIWKLEPEQFLKRDGLGHVFGRHGEGI